MEALRAAGIPDGVVIGDRQDPRELSTGEIWQRLKVMAWECCREINQVSLELEIVVGYLNVAAEDALTVANAMNRPFVNFREVGLQMEMATASHARYRRALMAMFKRCMA